MHVETFARLGGAGVYCGWGNRGAGCALLFAQVEVGAMRGGWEVVAVCRSSGCIFICN